MRKEDNFHNLVGNPVRPDYCPDRAEMIRHRPNLDTWRGRVAAHAEKLFGGKHWPGEFGQGVFGQKLEWGLDIAWERTPGLDDPTVMLNSKICLYWDDYPGLPEVTIHDDSVTLVRGLSALVLGSPMDWRNWVRIFETFPRDAT